MVPIKCARGPDKPLSLCRRPCVDVAAFGTHSGDATLSFQVTEEFSYENRILGNEETNAISAKHVSCDRTFGGYNYTCVVAGFSRNLKGCR